MELTFAGMATMLSASPVRYPVAAVHATTACILCCTPCAVLLVVGVCSCGGT